MSARVRYGRSSGTTRPGSFSYRRTVPSSGVLDTSARRTPALSRIFSTASGEYTVQSGAL